uniref:Uncharacterized protein n=1 Tax=Meloidogyne javanica TaxID=6303 RepID=A0A915M937_MELJA
MTNKSTGLSNRFYYYFKTFDENVQLKLEQYIINPFLTEIGYKDGRDDMFTKYLPMDQNTLWRYNEYLPQPRNQLSYKIREVCLKIIEGEMYHGKEYRSDKSQSGYGGSGDYLGGSHGASHGSHRGGLHHYGQGNEGGYRGYEHYPEFQGKYGGNP